MLLEIEKDFALTDHDHALIEQNCILQSEKTMQDIYMDTADFQLIGNNIWLRKRNGKIELKYPQGGTIHEKYVFEEYYDDHAREKLQSLHMDKHSIQPQFTVSTNRHTYEGIYQDIPFVICVDRFETSALYEIEVTHATTKQQGLLVIDAIVEMLGLEAKPTKGKVLSTIEKLRPELFLLLQERGIV